MRTQKGSILAFVVFIIVFAFSIAMAHGQTKVTASATISKEVKPWTGKTIKIGSATVPDTTKIHEGSRGGRYIYRYTKEHSRIYKMYLKK